MLINSNQIKSDINLINKRDGSWKAECTRRLIQENQIVATLCISRIHSSELCRSRIRDSAMNDLSAGDFVFKVVDMMKNCGWYGQADRILDLACGGLGEEGGNKKARMV
jgi:hypothetical protein